MSLSLDAPHRQQLQTKRAAHVTARKSQDPSSSQEKRITTAQRPPEKFQISKFCPLIPHFLAPSFKTFSIVPTFPTESRPSWTACQRQTLSLHHHRFPLRTSRSSLQANKDLRGSQDATQIFAPVSKPPAMVTTHINKSLKHVPNNLRQILVNLLKVSEIQCVLQNRHPIFFPPSLSPVSSSSPQSVTGGVTRHPFSLKLA